MGGLLRIYPLTESAMKEWAAMGCNGMAFEELPAWLKLSCKSGLQWAAVYGIEAGQFCYRQAVHSQNKDLLVANGYLWTRNTSKTS